MAARVKKKEGEKLTFDNIEKVINLLEAQKPITKKEACEILHISYNTTRLANIIKEHKDGIELDKKRRAANRGKPATEYETQTVIESYLEGDTIGTIADSLYRPNEFVKRIIDQAGVPSKKPGQDYFHPELLPDRCISDTFEVGDLVWSARYQAHAEIIKEYPYLATDGVSRVYSIYVLTQNKEPDLKFFDTWGKSGFYADQAACDLGKLSHLAAYGVNVKRIANKNAGAQTLNSKG